MCDNFCLWNREMFTEKDFWDYFSEETIIIDPDRGTSQLKSLCSMEYRHRLQKKISHIYHI
ncbi:hypothetical protein [Microcystis panniformis]|uniref:hypothetical protein n=1 Tax=Microcystis panniformis TaxID=513223 RepID=UPI002541A832|nr:hypothetical protein [Microcystis panniformis]